MFKYYYDDAADDDNSDKNDNGNESSPIFLQKKRQLNCHLFSVDQIIEMISLKIPFHISLDIKI